MSRARRDTPTDFYASVNDLMVATLFIFIILLVAVAVGLTQERDRLSSLVKRQFEARNELLERVARRARLPAADIDREQGIIRLPSEVLFASNSASLSPRGAATIARLAQALVVELPCYTRDQRRAACPPRAYPILEAVYIEGHTDSVNATRPWADNWDLSSARATRVYRAMIAKAPGLRAIRTQASGVPVLGASAYADSRPIARGRAAAARNRRVDLRFMLAPPEDV